MCSKKISPFTIHSNENGIRIEYFLTRQICSGLSGLHSENVGGHRGTVWTLNNTWASTVRLLQRWMKCEIHIQNDCQRKTRTTQKTKDIFHVWVINLRWHLNIIYAKKTIFSIQASCTDKWWSLFDLAVLLGTDFLMHRWEKPKGNEKECEKLSYHQLRFISGCWTLNFSSFFVCLIFFIKHNNNWHFYFETIIFVRR